MPKRDYWAWLTTTISPDEIEVDEKVLREGGLGMSVCVSEVLAGMGYGRLQLYEAGEHGWEQMMRHGEHGIWTRIALFDDDTYLLTVADQSGGWRRPWRPFVERILVLFNEALRRDPRIVDVKWMDPDNVRDDLGGFSSPADPTLIEIYEKKWGRR